MLYIYNDRGPVNWYLKGWTADYNMLYSISDKATRYGERFKFYHMDLKQRLC